MSELPEDPEAHVDTLPAWAYRFRWLWPLLIGALVGLVLRLIFFGRADEALNVMMASFMLLVPLVVGAVTVIVAERRGRCSWGFYFWGAALANAFLVVGTFLVLIEGLICIIIAAPLFAILGGFAGLATGLACRLLGRPRRAMLSISALPLLFGSIEQHLPLPDTIDTITRTRVINAAPERVWSVLLDADEIRPGEIGGAWMYRIGVPLPLSAITEERDGERVRHIEMGRGISFDQVAVDWQPQRRIEWAYRFSEDSFPPRALDEHVRIGGPHFDLGNTVYTLEPVAGGTQLTVSMSYRVSTHFNWYARLVAWFLVSDFEAAALGFYADRAMSMP